MSRDGGAASSVGLGPALDETHVVGADSRLEALLISGSSSVKINKDKGLAADGVIGGSGSSPSGNATLPLPITQAPNGAIPTLSGMAGVGLGDSSSAASPLAPT
jgi:hypothetical protein